MMRLPLRRAGCGALTLMLLLIGCRGGPLDAPDSGDRTPLTGGGSPAFALDVVRPAEASDERLPQLDDDSSLAAYQQYAALRNAELAASFYAWRASAERVAQVGALPDPRLTLGTYLGEVETRVGPMRHTLGVAQGFPWPGTLADREDVAGRTANAAWRRFEAQRRTLALQVERIWNAMYLLQRTIDITGENIELLKQVESVARSRYRVDVARHPELIRIQIELGKIEDRLRQLEARRAPQRAEFNAVLNRDSNADVAWPTDVHEVTLTADRETLRRRMEQEHPDLLALQEEIERERAGTELARKNGRPGFTVGLTWTMIDQRSGLDLPENGDDALFASVSMSIPLWREKYDAEVREALARRLVASNRHEGARQRLIAELETALFEYHDARRRVSLYRDSLLPKATESLNATLAAFAQGTSSFLDVLDVQRTLLEFQLATERARVDQATSSARLERLAGPLATKTEETMP